MANSISAVSFFSGAASGKLDGRCKMARKMKELAPTSSMFPRRTSSFYHEHKPAGHLQPSWSFPRTREEEGEAAPKPRPGKNRGRGRKAHFLSKRSHSASRTLSTARRRTLRRAKRQQNEAVHCTSTQQRQETPVLSRKTIDYSKKVYRVNFWQYGELKSKWKADEIKESQKKEDAITWESEERKVARAKC